MKHLTFTALLKTPWKPEIEIVWFFHLNRFINVYVYNFEGLLSSHLKTANYVTMISNDMQPKTSLTCLRWHWQNHLVTDEKCFRRSPFYETAMTTGVSEKHLLHCYLFFSLDDAKATLSINKGTKALTQQCIMNCGVWPSLPNPVESLSVLNSLKIRRQLYWLWCWSWSWYWSWSFKKSHSALGASAVFSHISSDSEKTTLSGFQTSDGACLR